MKLPETIYSVAQLEAYVFELNSYIAWLDAQHVKQKVGVKSGGGEPTLSQELVDLVMSQSGGSATSIEQLNTVKAVFSQCLERSPRVTVTLAAIPGPAVKKKLVSWFRHEGGENILIDFTANRNLLGGIMVRTKNRIFDYSFRKRIIDNRARLPEVLKRV